MDLSPPLEVMIRAARAAAESLMRDFRQIDQLRVEEKAPSDFVSSADLRAQAIVCAELSAACPGHALVLEEEDDGTSDGTSPALPERGPHQGALPQRGQHDEQVRAPESARARFIVDPLDGTTNFLRGLPHFSVAIALEMDGEVVAGVVLDPPKAELFYAEKGRGAWLGKTRLSVSRERELSRSVIGTGIPHHGHTGHARYLEALARVMPEVAGIRRLGSAALDLSYVAAGRFDGFFELGLAPWDVAAGALLVREAGGLVTKSDGSAMTLDGRDVLATCSAALHERMRGMLEPLHHAFPPGRAGT